MTKKDSTSVKARPEKSIFTNRLFRLRVTLSAVIVAKMELNEECFICKDPTVIYNFPQHDVA